VSSAADRPPALLLVQTRSPLVTRDADLFLALGPHVRDARCATAPKLIHLARNAFNLPALTRAINHDPNHYRRLVHFHLPIATGHLRRITLIEQNGDALQHTTNGLLVWRKAERIATYIWGTSMIPVIKDVKFKWDVAMIPAGKNGIWHRLGGACFCVSATTKQSDDAWNVTKWLVGEETQLAWVGTRLFAPTLTKVANSPQWADPSKAPANIKAFTDMTAHSRFIAVNYPAEAETNTALTSAFDAVWLGKQTAKTAAAAAAGPVQKLITTAATKRSSHLS